MTIHPAWVPSRPGRVPSLGCDFCAVALSVSWVEFGCIDFYWIAPAAPQALHMLGAWLACSGCAPLVRARAWRELVDRVITLRAQTGWTEAIDPGGRSELAALYMQLDRHLTGTETTIGRAA